MHPIIDTHVHFDDTRFDHDRDEVYQSAMNQGVIGMIVPAVTRARWPAVDSVSSTYKNVFATVGLHPVFCDQHQKTDLDLLEKNLSSKRYIAVGECGLDGFTKTIAMPMQKEYFSAQLELAGQFSVPVIIHARDAVEDVLLMLQRQNPGIQSGNGVIHSYNGSLQQAHRLIDLGYKLSFGGPVTYQRAKRLHRLIQQLPLDAIMLETDAPDQPGIDNQGKRNEPVYINKVLETVANLRGQCQKVIAQSSNKNACHLFNLTLT